MIWIIVQSPRRGVGGILFLLIALVYVFICAPGIVLASLLIGTNSNQPLAIIGLSIPLSYGIHLLYRWCEVADLYLIACGCTLVAATGAYFLSPAIGNMLMPITESTEALGSGTLRYEVFAVILAVYTAFPVIIRAHRRLRIQRMLATSPAVPPSPAPAWSAVGRWAITAQIATGRWGPVLLARNRSNPDEVVALKIYDRAATAACQAERKALENRSPYLPTSVESGQCADGHYLAVTYVANGTLRDLLIRHGTLSAGDAAWVTTMVLRALRAARQYHRDLRPEHLLVQVGNQQGGDRLFLPGDLVSGARIIVSGFGTPNDNPSATTAISRPYQSPEALLHQRSSGPSHDIFSMGVLLHEMVTGSPPQRGADHTVTLAPPHQGPSAIWAIIARCLDSSPSQRYRSHANLEGDLLHIWQS